MEDILSFFTPADLLVTIISTFGLIASIIVLIFTYKMLNLKLGEKVRGWIGVSSCITSDSSYFSTLLIENLKDRDLVIFDIYIRIGHNIYVDIFNKDSLNEHYCHTIPALSAREFIFGPAIAYYEQDSRVNISDIIFSSNIKKKIILSTSRGKVIAKSPKKGWSPRSDYFSNYGTMIICPSRYYTDKSIFGDNQSQSIIPSINYTSYGSRTLFLARVKRKEFGIVTYPIYKDTKVAYFQNLQFTDSSLSSKESLQKFLINAKTEGLIEFDAIEEIFDFQSFITQANERTRPFEGTIKAESWCEYHIIDRAQTLWYQSKEKYNSIKRNFLRRKSKKKTE